MSSYTRHCCSSLCPIPVQKKHLISLIQLNPTMRYPCSNDFHQHKQGLSSLTPFKGPFAFHPSTSKRPMGQPSRLSGQNLFKPNLISLHSSWRKERDAAEKLLEGSAGHQASQLTTGPTARAPGMIFIIVLMRSDMLCIHSHSG